MSVVRITIPLELFLDKPDIYERGIIMVKFSTILAMIIGISLLFAPAAVLGNLAGPPNGIDVNVTNDDAEAIPVRLISADCARQRMIVTGNLDYDDPNLALPVANFVPAGKVLVIETVSYTVMDPHNGSIFYGATLQTFGTADDHLILAIPPENPISLARTKQTQNTVNARAYIEEGDNVIIFFQFTGPNYTEAVGIWAVYGYYINANCPSP